MGNNRFTFEALASSIQKIHDQLPAQASKAANLSLTLTLRNWVIGCYIREYEQNGSDRADYGAELAEM